MASPPSSLPIPSELDDEADDAELPPGHMWVYPCKLPSCPDYGKSWQLRSNFLFHLMKQAEEHGASATTPAARRAIEMNWRYSADRAAEGFRADEEVWEYSIRDGNGKVVSGRGTLVQAEMHRASLP